MFEKHCSCSYDIVRVNEGKEGEAGCSFCRPGERRWRLDEKGVRGLESRGVVKFAAIITSSYLLSVHVGTQHAYTGFICRINSSK